jgi:hypothetical protein
MLQLALEVRQILKDELFLTQAFCLDPVGIGTVQ